MGFAIDINFHIEVVYKDLITFALKLGVSNTVFSPIEPSGGNNTKMTVSQRKMARFSFCKKGFEEEIVLYHPRI